MQFQVYTVNIEDRLPGGMPDRTWDRERILEEGFTETTKPVAVEKVRDGCIGIVWGRTEAGKSVAVRVDGVRPVLFFALHGEDTLQSVRKELEAEVSDTIFRDDRGIEVVGCTFCHFYGYEPDPGTASGRKAHRYAEARYPNLVSWRKAVRLRKEQEARQMRSAALAERGEVRRLQTRHDDARMAALRSPAEAPAYKTALAELTRAKARLSSMERRLEKQTVAPPSTNSAVDNHEGPLLRAAQESFVDPTTRFMQERDGASPSCRRQTF